MTGRSARLIAAARAGYGAALLWSPGPLTQAAAGRATGPGPRTTARVLGVRQLLQAAVTGGDPSPRGLRLGAATDAAHAASMAALAVTDRRWRRAALIDALAATTFAAGGLWAAHTVGAGYVSQAAGGGRPSRAVWLTQTGPVTRRWSA